MRYIICSRIEDEQNLVAVQYHGEIYYEVKDHILCLGKVKDHKGANANESVEEEKTRENEGGKNCTLCE